MRATGSLEPKPQGRRGHGKLAGSHDWVQGKIESKPDVTLDELVSALLRECDIDVQRSAMWGLVHRLGLDLSRFNSGSLRAILALKEINYDRETQ
jgi:transposase